MVLKYFKIKISPEDAKILYLNLNNDITRINDNFFNMRVSYTFWDKINTDKRVNLLDYNLRKRLEEFYQKYKTKDNLTNKAEKNLYTIFGKYKKTDYLDEEVIIKLLEDSDASYIGQIESDNNKIKQIQGEIDNNQDVINLRKLRNLLKENGDKLKEEIINHYNKDRLNVEFTKRNLSMVNIGVSLILIIATIVLTTYNINTAKNANELIERQLNIEEMSFIPNYAEIKINAIRTNDQPVPSYEILELVPGYTWTEGFGGQLQVFVANTGRIPTGVINFIEFEEDWVEVNSIGNRNYIRNIPAGEVNYTELYFKAIDINAIKTGLQNLTLRYDCKFCKPQVDKIKIPICIHNQTGYEECRIYQK
ncbi:MAG: hypothetical protein AABY32_03565 [Nanoarchaeota archaeon]